MSPLPDASNTTEVEEGKRSSGVRFLGRNVSQIPCFRDTLIYAIGSGTGVGILYTLFTSKNPFRLAFGVYAAVGASHWILCRSTYETRKKEAEMRRKLAQEMKENKETMRVVSEEMTPIEK